MRKFSLSFAVAVALLAVVVMVSLMPSATLPVSGAPPAAVITPVGSTSSGGTTSKFVTFFTGSSITADTRKCTESAAYDTMDLQFKVTQSGENTITLKHQYSNNASGTGFVNGDFFDANTFMSGTPVPASTPFTNMTQQATFGRYTCLYATVANTVPVAIYASAPFK